MVSGAIPLKARNCSRSFGIPLDESRTAGAIGSPAAPSDLLREFRASLTNAFAFDEEKDVETVPTDWSTFTAFVRQRALTGGEAATETPSSAMCPARDA